MLFVKEIFFVISKFTSCASLEKLIQKECQESRSHLISTSVTMPTLNLSSRGISCQIYGILQEKTDAKVYLAIVKYQINHNSL